ncbi:MAG TPA: hypothetical protein VF283_21885 [Bryobacteraceae bacterium]
MKATVVDLRYHMKDVLRAIDRGETVTVLYRGKEKAKLMPIRAPSGSSDKNSAKVQDQPFFGIWRDRLDMADPVAYIRRIRQPRPVLNPERRSRAKKPK